MKFTLTYDGPLPSNGRPSQKHAIRCAIHPQLAELRTIEPIATNVNEIRPTQVGEQKFTSLVVSRWGFRADLDILMLRPETPGGIVHRGDIDNRLKTLFDALTCPVHIQNIPANRQGAIDEDPIHCLLEDDSLIARVTVNTDRLLAAANPSHVKLTIGVKVWTTFTFGGLSILAPN